MRTSLLRILAAVCVATLATACGGGDSGGGDPGTDAGQETIIPLDIPPIEAGGDADAELAGDVPGEQPCVAECAKAGDRQCVPGVQGTYQVCEPAGDCLKWGLAQTCPGGQACESGQCASVCQSDPGCTKEGDRRCGSASAFQECEEVAAGCFRYGEKQACPGASVCVGDGVCECQPKCQTVGDRQCFAAEDNLFQTCEEDPAKCRVWSSPAACEGDAVCKGAGVCEEVCKGDCNEEGKVECASGTQYRICMKIQPGCLKWGEPAACPGTLTCNADECQVECTPDAACNATVGTTGCADAGHERACEEVLPGCIKWGAPAPCALHQACATSACACDHACDAGQSECILDVDPQFRKACKEDAAGCRFWDYEDCGGGSTCQAGACVAICESDPGCTAAGVTRCESLDSFATCAEVPDHPGCIQFGAPASCPVHQDCSEASGACACRVETGCTKEGAKRCIDYDNAATCAKDAAGCLYWGDPQPCAEGYMCNLGECSPVCVSDLDCPSAGSKRCTDKGLLQACVEIEPGCLKWAPPQACLEHQVCSGTQGCVCENPCKADESRCVGLDQRQSCAAPDIHGCTWWQPAVACDGGKSCVLGECATVTSPVVSCGDVTLNLVNQGWSDVKVAGTFSDPDWQSVPLELKAGVWTTTLSIAPAGTYEYKFIVDGTWMLDPLNDARVGTPPFDNNLFTVANVKTCDAPLDTQCAKDGSLEVCTDVAGCPAWKPAADPCTSATQYCETGVCHAIASPVVTDATVTFTVRDQGSQVEVTGDFTNPSWGAFIPLLPLTGRLSVTLQRAELPGLTAGKHPYKFHVPVVDVWFFDPANPEKVDDGKGGFNSILTIPPPCVPGCATQGETRCKDNGTMQTCGQDPYQCPAWLDEPCGKNPETHCLRTKCEPIPAVDATAKTATFLYPADASTAVTVVGDFTTPTWNVAAGLPMTLAGGLWSATSAALPPGTWKYKLVLNPGASETWIADPNNNWRENDGYGGWNCLFLVP